MSRRAPLGWGRGLLAAGVLTIGCAASRAAPIPPPPEAVAQTAPPPRAPRHARKPPTTFTPSGPAYRLYTAPPLKPDPRTRRGLSSIERDLLDLVQRLAAEVHHSVPLPDPRMQATAADVARLTRGAKTPPPDVVRFLANHHGVIETDPVIYTLHGPADPARVLARFAHDLPAVLQQGTFNRVAAATFVQGEEMTTVVALWQQLIELGGLPREAASRSTVLFQGRLLPGVSALQIVVTMPGGYVRRLPIGMRGERFEASLPITFGDGLYQVEMLATGADGPLVLANFPLYGGVKAPTEIQAVEDDEAEEIDPAEAEQDLLCLINEDRAAAGLGPLGWDNRLAAIARSHSRDMAQHHFVAHVSPTTGDSSARVEAAGLRFPLILENVGQVGTVAQAHQGFMNSPGHRANILNPRVTHVGLGVVVTPTMPQTILVTELFVLE